MGQRILSFQLEGMNSDDQWQNVYSGTSIGNKKICFFNPVTVKKIRLSVTNRMAEPHLSIFAVYNIKDVHLEPEKRENLGSFYNGITRKYGIEQSEEPALEIGKWDNNSFRNGEWKEMSFDLTKYVTRIGQYEVSFSSIADNKESGIEFKAWELEMYGGEIPGAIELLKGSSTFRITRSQQTLDEFPTIFRVKIKGNSRNASGNITIKRMTFK